MWRKWILTAALKCGELFERNSVKKVSKYKIIRTDRAGVFAGELVKLDGSTGILKDARRIWFWSGAATLSELAQRGTSNPLDCKFPCAVDSVVLLGVIEILDVTDAARKSIESVPVWSK